jgi:toxin ParE1/3/4
MPRFILAPSAASDIEAILAWSFEEFGAEAARRYEALIVRAIADVVASPDRPGVHVRDEIVRSARTYHLAHSRQNVANKSLRVKRPRHFLLFRVGDGGVTEIARVLHDSMDLPQHLPPELLGE